MPRLEKASCWDGKSNSNRFYGNWRTLIKRIVSQDRLCGLVVSVADYIP
jgi:hypothetical protein